MPFEIIRPVDLTAELVAGLTPDIGVTLEGRHFIVLGELTVRHHGRPPAEMLGAGLVRVKTVPEQMVPPAQHAGFESVAGETVGSTAVGAEIRLGRHPGSAPAQPEL